MQPEIKEIICPNCSSKQTKRHGTKKKKLQILQRYFCNNCRKTFTLQPSNKTYPVSLILNAISHYNLGYSQTEVSGMLSKTRKNQRFFVSQKSPISVRFKIKPSQKTISNWLNEFKPICTFSKLRSKAIKLYKPKSIIHKQTLNHVQPYTFKYHKAKLHLLFHSILYNNQFHNIARFYEPLKAYLEKISTDKFPHHIFTYQRTSRSGPNAADISLQETRIPLAQNNFNEASNITINKGNFGKGQNNITSINSATAIAQNNLINEKIKNNATSVTEKRASQIKFNHLKINVKNKNNFANKLTQLALQAAKTNKERHQSIQDFMLINDSTTIAIEVPIYLTNWDAGYYRNQKGFIFPLNNYKTPITGHIDILQIRNGLLHILDYKPEANKINAVEQLTIYALALSRKLNLPLYYFKCAWFDEDNYYEFFPLHAVFGKQKV